MRLFRSSPKLFQSLLNEMEGDLDLLSLEGQLGKLFELLRRRHSFDQSFSEVRRLSRLITVN
jgi:hypothetical protein